MSEQSCPKCAELAAAIAELQTLYREDERCMVEDGHSKRVDDTDYAAIGKEALDRHDAAKDAEIQRLRGAIKAFVYGWNLTCELSGTSIAHAEYTRHCVKHLEAALSQEVKP